VKAFPNSGAFERAIEQVGIAQATDNLIEAAVADADASDVRPGGGPS
jgi:hypothetical protein